LSRGLNYLNLGQPDQKCRNPLLSTLSRFTQCIPRQLVADRPFLLSCRAPVPLWWGDRGAELFLSSPSECPAPLPPWSQARPTARGSLPSPRASLDRRCVGRRTPSGLPSGGGSTILGRNFCSRTCQIGALDKLASEHYLLLMNVQTQPKTQIIAARIPAELHRDAKAAVALEGTTLQDKVIALLQRWLDERKAALAILASVQPREPRP